MDRLTIKNIKDKSINHCQAGNFDKIQDKMGSIARRC